MANYIFPENLVLVKYTDKNLMTFKRKNGTYAYLSEFIYSYIKETKDIENKPLSGFIIIKKSTYPDITIQDPRGFRIDVNAYDLVDSLLFNDCISQELKGEYLYGFINGKLRLVSVKSSNYHKNPNIPEVKAFECVPDIIYKTVKNNPYDMVYIGTYYIVKGKSIRNQMNNEVYRLSVKPLVGFCTDKGTHFICYKNDRFVKTNKKFIKSEWDCRIQNAKEYIKKNYPVIEESNDFSKKESFIIDKIIIKNMQEYDSVQENSITCILSKDEKSLFIPDHGSYMTQGYLLHADNNHISYSRISLQYQLKEFISDKIFCYPKSIRDSKLFLEKNIWLQSKTGQEIRWTQIQDLYQVLKYN